MRLDATSLWMLAFSPDSKVAWYIVYEKTKTNEKILTMNAYRRQSKHICVAENDGGEEPPKSMGTSRSRFNFGVSGGTVVEHRTSEREIWISKSTSVVLCPWTRHFIPRNYRKYPGSGCSVPTCLTFLTAMFSLNTNKHTIQFIGNCLHVNYFLDPKVM